MMNILEIFVIILSSNRKSGNFIKIVLERRNSFGRLPFSLRFLFLIKRSQYFFFGGELYLV